jgi:hypothetical protein
MPVIIVLFLISVAGGTALGQASAPTVSQTLSPAQKAAAVEAASPSSALAAQAAGFLSSVMAQNYLAALL